MISTWLVTGCSHGLGRSLAEAVNAASEKLAAKARDPAKLADLVASSGGRAVAQALALTDAAAAAIIAVTRTATPPMRLVLGSDAYARAERTDTNRLDEFRTWRAVSESTDFPRDDAA